ncbi:MAG: hypothetical protein DRJ56_02840 [Thermoprotei archaeon]|nr:MAG: hypothetical protein DRJ56_02840 [Thermoprotei archaeon]
MRLSLAAVKSVPEALRRLGVAVVERAGRREALIAVVLALNFTVAVMLRVMPMRWGVYLTEFDPYYEYYLAREIARRGWSGIAWWFQRTFEANGPRDTLFWYPYGRDLRATSQPGTAITSAAIYMILRSLGIAVDLYTVHAFVPAVGAALATLTIYLFGKRMWGWKVGLLSSFYIAITPAYLSRTMLGGKHEGLAIPFMLLAMYAYFKSAEERSMMWALVSGVAMGIVVLSWGGFIYPWNLMALFILVIALLGRLDGSMALSYVVMNAIATAFVAITPRFGPRIAFTSVSALMPALATLVSVVAVVRPKLVSERKTLLAIIVLALGAAGVAAWQVGLLKSVASRIMAVVLPQLRKQMPIIESVGEHRIPSWAMLYDDYQALVFFFAFGIYYLLRKLTPKRVFLTLFALTSLYGAMSLARLTLLLSPALVTVSSIGLVTALERIVSSFKAAGERKKAAKGPGRERYVVAALLILAVLTPSLGMVVVERVGYGRGARLVSLSVVYSHQPSLILTSSLSGLVEYKYEYVDWLSALEWMRENLPENAVVVCWWDYGYWISVNTNRSTLADNGTINVTQIRMIAKAFLSPEEEAVEIFRRYNVTHVVVFERFRSLADFGLSSLAMFYLPDWVGHGDFGKSYWMARIAGLDPSRYHATAYIKLTGGFKFRVLVPANTPEALNATLYKLIFVKTSKRRYFAFERLPPYFGYVKLPVYDGPLVSIESPKHFKLVYESEPNGWVLVFKVLYESEGG